MSRTNRGGAGLRLIIGLTASIAATVGVLAAYGSHRVTPECHFSGDVLSPRTAQKAGGNLLVVCTGISSGSNYQLDPSSNINSNTTITGLSITDLSNGVSMSTDNSLGASVSGESVVLKDSMGTPVTATGSMDILVLDYTFFPNTVVKNQADVFSIDGFITGNSYLWEVSNITSWDSATASGSGDGSSSGNAGVFDATSKLFSATGQSSGDYYINSDSSLSSNVTIEIQDSNGNPIDTTPSFNVTN